MSSEKVEVAPLSPDERAALESLSDQVEKLDAAPTSPRVQPASASPPTSPAAQALLSQVEEIRRLSMLTWGGMTVILNLFRITPEEFHAAVAAARQPATPEGVAEPAKKEAV